MREAPAQPAAGRVYLILALAVVAISLSAIFIRMAQAPGVVIASYRMVFAALVMLPLALRRGERGRFTGRSVLLALAAGFFLALHFATWISSLRSEEHTSELQSRGHLVCRLLLEKKKRRRSRTDTRK